MSPPDFEPSAPPAESLSLPLRFGEDGLVPAVIQEAETNAVLMVGFMNEEALALTRATGRVHFWSRSRRMLWRKGETSGHEQVVDSLYVNCEQNSLLVRVRQVGAACHDGYPTCYYRRLEPDNRLTVVRERAFDPERVYGRPGQDGDADEAAKLFQATRVQFGAYAFLRNHDLAAVSRTSARLRTETDDVTGRVVDELRELAGALDGSHRHRDAASDVALEGGQVLYWVTLAALQAGGTWGRLRADRALLTAADGVSAAATAAMLRADADRWEVAPAASDEAVARCHATLALVGQACRTAGVAPLTLVETDLDELRGKSYLAPFFASTIS